MFLDNLFNAALILIILDWIFKAGLIFYIPQNRKPNAAIAWLLVLFLLPWIGIILFLLIGSPKLSKRRRKIQLEIDKLIDAGVKHNNNRFKFSAGDKDRSESVSQLSESLGKLPVLGGNSIKVNANYDKVIEDIVSEVKKAKEFIHLEYFIIALDETTQPLFDALELAVKRGIKVRILIDSLGHRKYPRRKEMHKKLDSIGADWHLMLPIKLNPKLYNRPDLRNHRKIVVVDDKIAFVGSQNLIDKTYHRKDDIYYDELVVNLTGPIVRHCNVIFASDWYSETGEILKKLVSVKSRPMPKATGNVAAQMLPSGPSYELQNNAALFTFLFNSAKKRIFITNPYFIPSESMLDALITAAQRGVEVSMINSEVIDQIMVGHAQRSYYTQLIESGVKLYLYKPPILLHSKHLTIDDDIAVIGSSNLDIRSFELDLENTLITYDKSVVKDLVKVQNQDIKNSRELKLKTWQQRSIFKKFLDSAARLTSALQ